MHDIIVRFPSKQMADFFCGQMSDGYGEGFCNFNTWRKKDGTDGKEAKDFERLVEDGKQVCFVTWMEAFEDSEDDG